MKKMHFKTKNNTQPQTDGKKIIRLSTKLTIIFFTLVAVIAFCVFAGIYARGNQIIKDNATNAYLMGLQYSVRVMDEALSGAEYSTFPMLIDSRTKEYLRTYPGESLYNRYTADQYFLEQLKKIVIQNDYIESAYLYNASQGTIIGTSLSHTYSERELEESGWKDALSDRENYSLGKWTVRPSLSAPDTEVISNFKRIQGQNNQVLGVIAVNMRPEFWTETSGSSGGDVFEVMSFDTCGRVLLPHGDSGMNYIPRLPDDLPPEGYYTDRDYTITYVRSDYSGWLYLGAAKTVDILGSLVPFRDTVLGATLIIVIVSSIALLMTTAHIMHPVNVLKTSMERVGTGDFSQLIDEERNDDFQILYNGYNSMVTNLKSTVQTVYRQQLEKKDMSMRILRSQIDAHFLYNTLDTVHWISVLHDDAEVSEIVMHLASYYRIMLNKGRDLLTLKDCVELIENYLQIWQIKNDSDIIFHAEIPEEYLHAYVLKNLFQPLIENSIQHGMSESSTPLTLTLRCRAEPERGVLHLSVEDNGAGIPQERLEEINKVLTGAECDALEGSFALRNINSQLMTYYGENYGLKIGSEPGKYTLVSMMVPIKWHEDE